MIQIGDKFLNRNSGGIGIIQQIDHGYEIPQLDGEQYKTQDKYLIHGISTGRSMWIGEDSMSSFISLGILIPQQGELITKWIKKHRIDLAITI